MMNLKPPVKTQWSGTSEDDHQEEVRKKNYDLILKLN